MQMTFGLKRLRTAIAQHIPLASVNQIVPPACVQSAERFAASLADVGLLSSVDPLVNDQTSREREGLVAARMVAGIRHLSRVFLEVNHQVVVLLIGGATLVALVRPGLGVGSHVSFQPGGGEAVPTANWTRERFSLTTFSTSCPRVLTIS